MTPTTEHKRLEDLQVGLRGIVTSIVLSSLVSCLVVLGGGWAIVSTVFQVHLQTTHPGAARTLDVQSLASRLLDSHQRIISRFDRLDAAVEKLKGEDDD